MKHGLTAYQHRKCRCDICRAAKRASDQRYYAKKGRPPRGNPCTINGKTYRTQNEAALALGIRPQLLSWHLNKHGDFSRFGEAAGGRSGGHKKPVRVGSREWPSRAALARYVGLPESRIRWWLRSRKLDCLVAAVMQADAKQRSAA